MATTQTSLQSVFIFVAWALVPPADYVLAFLELTDRIDLGAFYPFLAGLADCCHLVYQLKPTHQACLRRITNSPNPYTSATVLSKDEAAKLVVLGDYVKPHELMSPTWCPTAASDMVRAKLFRRYVLSHLFHPNVS